MECESVGEIVAWMERPESLAWEMPENPDTPVFTPGAMQAFFWASIFSPLLLEALLLPLAARSEDPAPYVLWALVALGCCLYATFRLATRWVSVLWGRILLGLAVFSGLVALNVLLLVIGIFIFDPPDFH